jgi:hypothetical protein
MSEVSLDSIYGDEPEVFETEPKAVKVEETAPTEEVSENQGEKQEDEPPAPQEETKEEQGLVKAMLAERDKRQESERKVKELEEQISKQETVELPDPIDSPADFKQNIMDETQASLNTRIYNMAEAMVRSAHPDFDAMVESFEASATQADVEAARAAPNPALELYNIGKRYKEVSDIGDPTTYKERLRAEILQEIKDGKTSDDKEAKKTALKDNLTKSLAGEQTKGVKEAPFVEQTLQQIYGD